MTKLEQIKAQCREAIGLKPWTTEEHGGELFLISPEGWDDGFRADYPKPLAEAINRYGTFSPAAARALLTAIEALEKCSSSFTQDGRYSQKVLDRICQQWSHDAGMG